MKYKLLFSLATAVALVAADPVLYLPENVPIPVEWDHDRRLSSPGTYYRLYHGTNLVQIISTNDFVVKFVQDVGPTAGQSTLTAKPIFDHVLVVTGTNRLTITAVEPLVPLPAGESDPSTNILIGQVVGKPLPPQGIRKP